MGTLRRERLGIEGGQGRNSASGHRAVGRGEASENERAERDRLGSAEWSAVSCAMSLGKRTCSRLPGVDSSLLGLRWVQCSCLGEDQA